jgi:hypothetical protein
LLILDFDLSPKNSMGSFKISLNNIIIITFFYFLRIFYFLKN